MRSSYRNLVNICAWTSTLLSRSLVLQNFGNEKQRGKMREFELQKLTSRGSVPLICIKIISSSGKESNLTVSVTDTVNAVKDRALGGEYSKESHLYKLLLAKSNKELIDEKTLDEENVQENGKCTSFMSSDCFFSASSPIIAYLSFRVFSSRRVNSLQKTSQCELWFRRKSKSCLLFLFVLKCIDRGNLFFNFLSLPGEYRRKYLRPNYYVHICKIN